MPEADELTRQTPSQNITSQSFVAIDADSADFTTSQIRNDSEINLTRLDLHKDMDRDNEPG